MLSYPTQKASVKVSRTYVKDGIYSYFRSGRTMNILAASKDKDTIKQKSWVTWWYRCRRLYCDEQYSAESARNFCERFKEYLKTLLPICI